MLAILEMMINENYRHFEHFVDTRDYFGNDENSKQIQSFVNCFEFGRTEHFVEDLFLECSFVFSFTDTFPMSFSKNCSH